MNDDRGRRRLIGPVPAAILACLTGCYEQPVVEGLALVFLPEGGVRVTVTHRIDPPPAVP